MEQKKKFYPFDRILVKHKNCNSSKWTCDIFSHIRENGDLQCVGYCLESGEYDIIPFAGNEHLVGTSDMPEEEVELKEGDIIVTFDNIRDIEMPFEVSINQFKHLNENTIHVCIKPDEKEFLSFSKYCIPFPKFNPNDLEETRKHILCVKNGKLVKAMV